jgi:hypothetical protein
VFKKGVVEISFLFLCPELTGAIQVDNVWLSFLALVLFITTGVGAGLIDRKMDGYI